MATDSAVPSPTEQGEPSRRAGFEWFSHLTSEEQAQVLANAPQVQTPADVDALADCSESTKARLRAFVKKATPRTDSSSTI